MTMHFNDDEDRVNKDFKFTFLNTNARSLSPKINSLIECFDEMDASVAIVTETWLTDGGGLEEDLDMLEAGSGLGSVVLNLSLIHI